MKDLLHKIAICLTLSICLTPASRSSASSPAAKEDDVLLSTMQQELQRARESLGKLDPAPYFLSYSVKDQSAAFAIGSQGSLLTSTFGRRRSADVIIRIGTPTLDNAHEESRSSAVTSVALPLEGDPNAIARVLWRLTSEEYRKASRAYANVKTSTQVHAQEEDTSPDFTQESPQTHSDYGASSALPGQQALEKLVRQYSSYFRKYPEVYTAVVMATVERTLSRYVSSEGTRIVTPNAMVRISIEAGTRADDGMDLMRVETFQTESLEQLPPESEIAARVEKMAADLKALRAAPLAEPFDGPALLSGRATAVFFHEVLGHRLEGHRQRGEKEGQTFTKKVNQAVLPDFLSVSDDPSRRKLDGVPLSGWYEFDDEGIPATPVVVIQNGILKNFLMSRMPIKNFDKSNGHGRSQPGLMPTGRQGNLIVSSSKTVKDSDLRQKLKDEIKKQGKPYGLYFEDIQGGFTLTQRGMPQAFQVLPVLVWRVYSDDRPDELVRGVDIVGTPLAAMEHILLTGDKTAVFNGICGAESGSVPVSAAAPAMLFSDIEVQKRAHSLNRPPILPPPGFETSQSPQPAKSGGPAVMTAKIHRLGRPSTVLLLLLATCVPFVCAQQKNTATSADPVLHAMGVELERSRASLKLDQMAAPYYIEYRVFDVDEYDAEAAYGALRSSVRARFRFLRVAVRIGDYKQDSYRGGKGEGAVSLVPLDDDLIAMRHQIWEATDRAYKAAVQELTAKEAQLKQYTAPDQPVDDFAHAEPVQSVGALAKLDFDPQPWLAMLQNGSSVYKDDPLLQSAEASLKFQAVNRYLLNSEGTIVRSGYNLYEMTVAESTQAPDGMKLDRSHAFTVASMKELPSADEFHAQATKLLATLKLLRDAPLVDEEYRGPVLFSADSAADVFANLVGEHVLGHKPELGKTARTTGQFAASYKTRVLPDFLSVVDDPTIASFQGHSLLGNYAIDDEGVKAQRVSVIENGKLINYLVGREPIRDFPASNGHGRARVPSNPPGPSLGNLIVTASESFTAAELKRKLIEICQQRDLPYGYFAETLGPQHAPRLLYKVWVKDGREELVRGGSFGDLDSRALRNDLVAAGNDFYLESHVLNIPHSIVSPSILFDELEIKRVTTNKDRLPDYPAPPLVPGK